MPGWLIPFEGKCMVDSFALTDLVKVDRGGSAACPDDDLGGGGGLDDDLLDGDGWVGVDHAGVTPRRDVLGGRVREWVGGVLQHAS